jgi:hypothetical protein
VASIASPATASVKVPADWTERLRVPLAATAAVLIAIDFIGLGLNLADAPRNAARSNPAEQRAQTRVAAPEAVVDSGALSSGTAAASGSSGTRTAAPSGVLIGPVAPPVVTTQPGSSPSPNSSPPTPAPEAPAVPLAQTGVAVPALGAQVSLGLGENSCTTVDLTLLALGDCPAPEGDGAVILQLGGSLLGN